MAMRVGQADWGRSPYMLTGKDGSKLGISELRHQAAILGQVAILAPVPSKQNLYIAPVSADVVGQKQ